MKTAKKRLASLLLILGIFILPNLLLAQDQGLWNNQEGMGAVAKEYGQTKDGAQDIRLTVAKIIRVVLSFLGIIFVALLIFAGFKYMTAQGNEEQLKSSLAQIKNAVIGTAIIFASWGITTYIINKLALASGLYYFGAGK